MQALEDMTGQAEYILQQLGFAVSVIVLCGGDMGFGAVKPMTYRWCGYRLRPPTVKSLAAQTVATSSAPYASACQRWQN